MRIQLEIVHRKEHSDKARPKIFFFIIWKQTFWKLVSFTHSTPFICTLNTSKAHLIKSNYLFDINLLEFVYFGIRANGACILYIHSILYVFQHYDVKNFTHALSYRSVWLLFVYEYLLRECYDSIVNIEHTMRAETVEIGSFLEIWHVYWPHVDSRWFPVIIFVSVLMCDRMFGTTLENASKSLSAFDLNEAPFSFVLDRLRKHISLRSVLLMNRFRYLRINSIITWQGILHP